MGSDRARRRGVAPTPASFRRVCTPGSQRTRDRGGNTVRERARRGRTWVCLRSRGSPSSSKSSPPAFSFHSDAITIANDARECYQRGRLARNRRRIFQLPRQAKEWPKRTCVNKASPRFYRAGRRLSGRLLSASNVDGSLVNNAGESHSATAPSLWGTAFKKSASSRTNNTSNVRPRGDNAATTEICKSFFCFLARVPRIRPSHVWVFTQGSDDENPGKNNPRALE